MTATLLPMNPTDRIGWTLYRAAGFSLELPADWQADLPKRSDRHHALLTAMAPSRTLLVHLLQHPHPQSATMSQESLNTDLLQDPPDAASWTQRTNIDLIEHGLVDLSKQPAAMAISTGRQSGLITRRWLHHACLLIPKPGAVWQLVLAGTGREQKLAAQAFEQHRSVLDAIAMSLILT